MNSDALAGLGGGIFTVLVVFLLVLAVLWFCLPFAVFGTKPLLREILATQRQILAHLRSEKSAEVRKPPSDDLVI